MGADKSGIEESLHVQITRARLTACEVGVFSREISQLSKIHPPPSFRSHLSSSPMGVFSRDYGILICSKCKDLHVKIANLTTVKSCVAVGPIH